MEEDKEQLITCTVRLIRNPEPLPVTPEALVSASAQESPRAVALKGDAFINGIFIPAEELEKNVQAWEGTLHDINHKGTGLMPGTADITYFVGWNSNVKYDPTSKSLSMDINISDKTQYAAAWHGYVDVCESSGQTPNVSVSFYAKTKRVRASDLPSGVDYKVLGYSAEDTVLSVYNIRPQALSTVFEGACNDKEGCGIGKCSCEVCEATETPVVNEEENARILKEREKIIEWLKNHDK